MRRILVTAISGDIGNGILKILKFKDNILFGCDVNEIAVGMDLVKEFWQSKYAMEDGYIEDMLEKCIQHQITHLIPVNEREIEKIGSARMRFEEHGIKLVILEQNILDVCLDKYETVNFLRNHGIGVPDTYLDIECLEKNYERYICKPRKSNGSKDIFLYKPGTDVPKEIDGVNYVVQQYIDSREEYTIGIFRTEKCINTIIFQRELKNGYSNLVKLVYDEALKKLAEKIAKILDLKGYLNIQLRKFEDKYYIFEMNPRISGTVRFRDMLGFSDVMWWLEMLDGKEVPVYHCRYQEAVGIRELNEKYLVLK